MTPAKKNDGQTEREFIDYRFTEVFKRLDRMEGTMNSFAFVKQTEFDELAKEVRERYVKKEELAWVKYVTGGIAIGVGVALVVAILKLVGANL